MVLTDRMQALGAHARSSNQRLIAERRQESREMNRNGETRGRESDDDALDTFVSGNGAEGMAEAIIVDRIEAHLIAEATAHDTIQDTVSDAAPEPAALDNIEFDELPQVPLQAPANDARPQDLRPAAAEAAAKSLESPPPSRESDDDLAAKRAIIHEWQNWSALNSDELSDPNVATYFFRHMEAKKPRLLDFPAEDKLQTVRGWLMAGHHLAA